MKKLLLSFAVIMALLVLVSCPDGMMPSALLDVSIQVEEGSEISLDKFEKLTYTIKDVGGDREVTQVFDTITNIVTTQSSLSQTGFP